MTSTATIVRIVGPYKGTPGPGAYTPPSDFGKAPAYTIKHKYPDRTERNKAGYENLPNTVGTGHKYTMSIRPKDLKTLNTPGPNYMPPKLGQEAPAHAFHMKEPEPKNGCVSPGPGKYNTSKGLAGPKYTMKARKFVHEEGTVEGPGGGKYFPDYDKVMPSRPKTGIGIKHKAPKRAATPGPGQYDIDRSPPSKAAAFHIKRREMNKDNFPLGKYDTSVPLGTQVPKYSIRTKNDIPEKPLAAPYQKIPEKFGKEAPKYSLSSRHKEIERPPIPGPSYMPPPFGSEAIKYSCTSRREKSRNMDYQPGPGAGKYNTRPNTGGPAYTIKSKKYPKNDGVVEGPGGGKYLPDYDKVLPSRPKTAILEKHEHKPDGPLPGYVDLGGTFAGPKWTIGRKEELEITPGVNA
ncbi:hypothetical protein TRFO_08017 [Tritrichomonas foetus]|uniref:Outer dense fiber protein 3 n=1 Tax=Tritrichomonas foetus TaxID=1144522 RepID=A0A1J4JMJ9_9EUKA|nr:hypothetical protein TRFO_08017 [Tritrichomonas foetus]|eukprot:OHT00345.1 hypothetical protein TRFO_08017 [Tritrichomonas foetus]